MRYVLVCAAVLAVVVPGLARAAADDAAGGEEKSAAIKSDRAFYGTLGGVASLDAYTLGNQGGAPAQGETGWGMDARAGYRFYPNLAAELQYQFIPRNEVDF